MTTCLMSSLDNNNLFTAVRMPYSNKTAGRHTIYFRQQWHLLARTVADKTARTQLALRSRPMLYLLQSLQVTLLLPPLSLPPRVMRLSRRLLFLLQHRHARTNQRDRQRASIRRLFQSEVCKLRRPPPLATLSHHQNHQSRHRLCHSKMNRSHRLSRTATVRSIQSNQPSNGTRMYLDTSVATIGMIQTGNQRCLIYVWSRIANTR